MSPPKILTVVGARPQFIKAAVLSPVLREQVQEVLVHTGQHYDESLSDVFFRELPLPVPDYQLNIGAHSIGTQTARIIEKLDTVILKEQPQIVLVFGDTTSTLAGAIAGASRDIPVVHVEAGLRSFDRHMPEEKNRVVTDHLAARLYCPTAGAVNNLSREGLVEGVLLTGDVMDDAVRAIQIDSRAPSVYQVMPFDYALVTVHRQQTAEDPQQLKQILSALRQMPFPILFPLHPRTRASFDRFALWRDVSPNVQVIEPVGYQRIISLIASAKVVLTDSGGVQREAALLGRPTFVLREETEWMDLVHEGRVVLCGTDAESIVRHVRHSTVIAWAPKETWHSPSRVIVDDISNYLKEW